MNKYIIILFILLVITLITKPLLSPFIENFSTRSVTGIGRGYGIGGVGHDLDYVPQTNIPNGNLFGNMRYPGKAYLSIAEPSGYLYNNQTDDAISFFSFPFRI
jgi:hypothetical protein